MSLDSSGQELFFKTMCRVSQLVEEGKVSTKSVTEAFSQSQFLSKNWLVEVCLENGLDLGTVFLCGGWYATLFLDLRLKYSKVRSFDVDPACELVADEIHRHLVLQDWRFKAATDDIHKINYDRHSYQVRRKDGTLCELTDSPDTVINTSCEHIRSFKDWYRLLPKGKLLILQSNNGFSLEEHVNCSKSLAEFAELTPMTRVLYSGERPMTKFVRYMRIGYR